MMAQKKNMQAIHDRLPGLTNGTSSRFLRAAANRFILAPSLEKMRQTQASRPEALQDRIDDLLVFEILKQGGTAYHQFTARTLYKHVLKAITKSGGEHQYPKSSGMQSIDLLAPNFFQGSGGPPLDERILERSMATTTTTTAAQQQGEQQNRPPNLVSIQDSEALDHLHTTTNDNGGTVTYRERLGGYLHPRDIRKLATPFSAYNEPELIVRRHAMLLNFDTLRAIILRDRLLVLVPEGADSILVELEKRIRGNVDFTDMVPSEYYGDKTSNQTKLPGCIFI